MDRRAFLKTASLGLAASALPGILPRALSGASDTKPNIVIIFADDLGYGDIPGFGLEDSPYEAPNLVKMASQGKKFTRCYVPTPYCAPSRATLLTGRYPFRNGVVHNPAPDSGINYVGLPNSEVTIAEVLKEHNYSTSCIGKWHLGHQPEFLPRRQGFDEYYGILYSNDMYPVQLIENESVAEYPVYQPDLTKKYTHRALDFIERNYQQDNPFFLYLAHAMPHKPLAASEDFYTHDTKEDLYADVVRELDWSVGEILNKLRELKIERDTLVFFLSDNGPWYGGSTGGLRGMKARTWDGGLRVPMIAWQPTVIPPGETSDAIVGTIDFFPTILNHAGITVPENLNLDGEDISPLLIGDSEESPHEFLVGMHGTEIHTLIGQRYKLHARSPGGIPDRGEDWVDPRGPDGVKLIAPFEQSRPTEYPGVTGGAEPKDMMLFDLQQDPSEQKDVSDAHPDVMRRMTRAYESLNKEIPEFGPPKRDFQGLRRLQGGSMNIEDWKE